MGDAERVGDALPRPEHPRPDFRRRDWVNLNGRWDFCFDPDDLGEQERWFRRPAAAADVFAARPADSPVEGAGAADTPTDPFGTTIVVPFPWQSPRSGVADRAYKGAAWYRRSVVVPDAWAHSAAPSALPAATAAPASAGDTARSAAAPGAAVVWRMRPYLCFGAVDWGAKVWVDGHFVGEHAGGYTPFAFDLSHFVRPGRPATLTVRAWDTSAADTLVGKQVQRWYTHTGGIWQTVWLEARPAAHLAQVRITPRLEAGGAEVAVTVASSEDEPPGTYRLLVTSPDGAFPEVAATFRGDAAGAGATLWVAVPQPRAWSPDAPHLYDCLLRLAPEADAPHAAEADAVASYFGLRSIAAGRWDGRDYEFVLLNGEPVYLRGALDQAFHPEGAYTYPSDAAIRADIQAAKDLGLNMLRCHIKINDPRYYYWADRLGVLIMYDIPNAELYTPTARANWERTLRDALERDRSHPCIFAWVLFNETWGLDEYRTPTSWAWVLAMYELAKALDPSRLVEDMSPNKYDHVRTDLNSWHFYIDEYRRARRHIERVVEQTGEGRPFNYVGGLYQHLAGAAAYAQGAQPLLNSEFAGAGARSGDIDVSYSCKFLTTELRRHDKICGYVYTELTDVEWEHNGYLNYDRSPKEFGYAAFVPGMGVADLNGADFVGLDCPPCQTLPPGGSFGARAFLAHWDRRELAGAVLRWQLHAVDRFGERCLVDEGGHAVVARRYGVADAGQIEARLPDAPALATVGLVLLDGAGAVRARNYVNVDVSPPRPAPGADAEHWGDGYALSFLPEDFADTSWPNPMLGRGDSKFGGAGAGWVEYALRVPEGVEPGRVRGLSLRFEAGARTARRRIDWPDRLHVKSTDYPQTEARKYPTRLAVSINGLPLGERLLPDDPADARGVLSLHLQGAWEFASYGYLTRLEADEETARRLLLAAGQRLVVRFEVPRSGPVGGLNLYGARMGAYPLRPTILIAMAPDQQRHA